VRRNYPLALAGRMGAPVAERRAWWAACVPRSTVWPTGPVAQRAEGDLVAVFCAGAYGASASPSAFLGHGPAAEILI
jgi:diaminopimelate decarboxylase